MQIFIGSLVTQQWIKVDDQLKEKIRVPNTNRYYVPIGDHERNEIFGDPLFGLVKHVKIVFPNGQEKLIPYHQSFLCDDEKEIPEDFRTFVGGGRTGDLIHVLYVPFAHHHRTGQKARLYITDDLRFGGDAFQRGAETVYNELLPILSQLDYIESFHVLTQSNAKVIGAVNLNIWRQRFLPDPYWLYFLTSIYQVPLLKEPWISIDFLEKIPELEGKVVVHQAPYRLDPHFPWEKILKNNDCVFVTSNSREYDEFPWHDLLPLYQTHTLTDMYRAILSCKFFVGNQSSPLAMAMSVHKPCLGQLNEAHMYYQGLEKYHSKFFWFNQNISSHIQGLEKYLIL